MKKEKKVFFKFPYGKKEKKYRGRKEKIIYSVFEIFTLVLSIISFTFIIGCLTGEIQNVSAEGIRCCLESNDGSMCQEYASGDCGNECKDGCIPIECAGIPECDTGCCIDSEGGTCSANSMKAECEQQGGLWHEDVSCEISECKKGCCVLGTETQFVTARSCKKLSESYGFAYMFKTDLDEMQCYEQSGNLEVGACITGESLNEISKCKFTTRTDCLELTGSSRNFYKNHLCSNSKLNTECERQHSTGCVEGRDEIYWFDSCGNMENIYSANTAQSWNSGMVLSKEESCYPNRDNSNSENCGNCNYELGSVCREYNEEIDDGIPKDGDYICRDLNCYDAPMMGGTQNRVNGESWCVYDGITGFGKDLVGSRHFKYVCIDGEVEVEPCADYRQEICVQDTNVLDNGDEIDEAMCRVNMWEDCFTKNTEEGCADECLVSCPLNPDCRVQKIKLADDFAFAMCVPDYPSGFDLSPGLPGLASASNVAQVGTSEIGMEGVESYTLQQENVGSHMCSLGSQTCVYVEQKTLEGWECVHNCGCIDKLNENTIKMNNLCTSLGDCGIYSNFKGTTTVGGFSVGGDGVDNAAWNILMVGIIEAVATNVGKLVSETELGGEITSALPGFFKDIEDIDKLPYFGIAQMFGYNMGGINPYEGNDGILGMFEGPGAGQNIALAGGAALAGGSLGAIFGGTAAVPGLFGSTSPILGATPAAAAGLTTIVIWAVVAVVVVIAVMKFLGIGETREREVKFTCMPWMQPILKVRSDCEYCNEDPFKPCSDYRCESLGTRCYMVKDKTEEYGTCIDRKGEDTVPLISPWEDVLNKSLFMYSDASRNGFRIRSVEGECVPAFSVIGFGIKTDVYASCKIATDSEMTDARSFLEGNKYGKNHSMILSSFPSYDAVMATLEEHKKENPRDPGIEEITKEMEDYIESSLQNINLYVKCQNIDGEENEQDFKINICVDDGPDLRPPFIYPELVNPLSGSYVPFIAENKLVKFIVTEPSECRWSKISPSTGSLKEKFEAMKNEISCETEVFSGGLLGYNCSVDLPLDEGNESEYYIMCKDQPWQEDDELRNVGNIFEYKLIRSESNLVIDSISPSGEIEYGGSEYPAIDLEVQTSGGASNGLATCEYNTIISEKYVEFLETGGVNVHKQLLTSLPSGVNKILVRCEDVGGNIAINETNINLANDDSAPVVIRTFGRDDVLTVMTNEDSFCFADTNVSEKCSFDILEDSESIAGFATNTHELPWDEGVTYYIKCKDIWGNQKDDCSIIIKPTV